MRKDHPSSGKSCGRLVEPADTSTAGGKPAKILISEMLWGAINRTSHKESAYLE